MSGRFVRAGVVALVGALSACATGHGSKPDVRISFLPQSQALSDADQDALVIAGMRQRGGDVSKPVKIDYFYYASNESDAVVAARDLTKAGYRCSVHPPAEQPRDPAMSSYWLVDAREKHVVSVAHFQAVQKRFEAEAARFADAAYDGYEADDPPRR